jgi:hypothetical protein
LIALPSPFSERDWGVIPDFSIFSI